MCEDASSARGVERVRVKLFVMVEDTLWEGSATGCPSQGFSETERFGDWEICGEVYKWGSRDGLFRLNLTSSLCKALVDAANGVACGLDRNHKDWLLEAGLSCELSSQKGASCCWDDLITTSMGVVLVSHDINDIVPDASLVLLSEGTFFGYPLETGFDGVSDLPEVLSL